MFPETSCLAVEHDDNVPTPILPSNKIGTSAYLFLPISLNIAGQQLQTTALLDTSASHNFIDLRFVEMAGWR